MNLKQIATTIAMLGSGALVLTGCEKDPAATEVPGGDGAMDAEASCAADDHPDDGHCGGDAADGGGADEALGDADDAAAEDPAAE